MAYSVGTADIEARWRPLSDAENDVASALIDDAITLLDVMRPDLSAAVTSGAVPDRIVTMTICEIVIRVLANPDILAQQSITADGGVSVGWQFASSKPAPRIRITLADLAAIDAAYAVAGLGSNVTGSLKMTVQNKWPFCSSDTSILPTA